MAWTTDDEKADLRIKYASVSEYMEPGYWYETNLSIRPDATIIRVVNPSLGSTITPEFYCRNTTLNDLPAGCK